MKKELFSLHGVSCSIGNRALLDRVNLVLFEKEIVFLVGTPDCGKDRLANVLAGIEKPDHGKMYHCGVYYHPEERKQAEKQGIYMVQSNCSFMGNMTIAENVGLVKPPMPVHPFYRKKMKTVLSIICQEYAIPLKLDKMADRLSPSEIVFIHLARAILLRTKVLIMQDLLYLLREKEVNQVFETIRKMKDSGISFLILESTAQYAGMYGNRILFMQQGMIIADKLHSEVSRDEASILSGMQMKGKRLDSEENTVAGRRENQIRRVLLYPTPWGSKSIMIDSGQCIGVTCENSDLLLWFLERAFTRERLNDVNDQKVSVVNLNNLQKDCFYFMKFDDNLILPVLRNISVHGILFPKRHLNFLKNEFAKTSFAKKKLWKRDLYSLPADERMNSVLYRVLIEGTDLVVLTGHLEQLSKQLLDEVRNVIRLATGFHKSVVLYAKNCEIMEDLCDEIVYLDSSNDSNV